MQPMVESYNSLIQFDERLAEVWVVLFPFKSKELLHDVSFTLEDAIGKYMIESRAKQQELFDEHYYDWDLMVKEPTTKKMVRKVREWCGKILDTNTNKMVRKLSEELQAKADKEYSDFMSEEIDVDYTPVEIKINNIDLLPVTIVSMYKHYLSKVIKIVE